MSNEAAKNTALAGIAGIGVLGLSGWAAVIYAAYNYGKGRNGRALTSLGAGVVAFIAARAVAKATVKQTKAALQVPSTFTPPAQVQPAAQRTPQERVYVPEDEPVASAYDVE